MTIVDHHYRKVHHWLIKTYGKANHCDLCHVVCSRYEWALKKGHEYIFDRKVFMQLCTSCHRKYDITENTILKCSDRMKREYFNSNFCQIGNIREKSPVARKVMSTDKNGNLEYFNCITSIYDKYPHYWKRNIASCLAKERKTAHEKIWEYND